MSLPSADMIETPPGYPFEEIDYVDIEVEEVSNKLAISTFDWNVRDPMMQKLPQCVISQLSWLLPLLIYFLANVSKLPY